MENLKGFMYPITAKCEEITILDQKQPFELNRDQVVCRPRPIFV